MQDRHPSYTRVFLTFARNSLVRDLSFRTNFVLQSISSVSWTLMNVGFYLIVFHHTPFIGPESGWGKYEFFVFLGTTWLINSVVQAFFMPNLQQFSELIRTGKLDFVLLKPIDTQFLVSFEKVDWSSFANFAAGLTLVVTAMWNLMTRSVEPLRLEWWIVPVYVGYLICGIAILYSLMIALAATSVWLGRNQTLYDFWFYITNFARYPMEMYNRGLGVPLYGLFTYVLPVLVVVNVPARILAQPLFPESSLRWPLAVYTLMAAVVGLFVSRWIFTRALLSYRSASS